MDQENKQRQIAYNMLNLSSHNFIIMDKTSGIHEINVSI